MMDWIPWIVGGALVWFAIVIVLAIVVTVFIVRTFRDIRRDHLAMDRNHQAMRDRIGRRPGSRRR